MAYPRNRPGTLRFAPSHRQKVAESNAANRGMEAMFGDVREAKGMPLPERTVLPEKRAYTKREREPGELSELQEQIRVVTWWDKHCHEYRLPPVALFAIPNGGGRGTFEGANMKRAGVRAGAEDLLLTVPMRFLKDEHEVAWHHGLFIEMKVIGGNVEPEQYAMHHFHRAQGYRSEICWSHQEAIELIQDYLVPF